MHLETQNAKIFRLRRASAGEFSGFLKNFRDIEKQKKSTAHRKHSESYEKRSKRGS